MGLRVLLVDDDVRLFELLSRFFGDHDVALGHAPDGARGLEMLAGGGYDAVLLDVMMPGPGGLAVLEQIRSRDKVAVIMLTARGDEADRIAGLDLGADDYVAKPFSPRELLSRLRAVTRRGAPTLHAERLTVGDLEIDVAARAASHAGRALELTAVEFDILVALVRRAGRTVPRGALLDEAGRGDVNVGERTIDVHISRLRKQLGLHPGAARIETIRGVGYMLALPAGDGGAASEP